METITFILAVVGSIAGVIEIIKLSTFGVTKINALEQAQRAGNLMKYNLRYYGSPVALLIYGICCLIYGLISQNEVYIISAIFCLVVSVSFFFATIVTYGYYKEKINA